MFFLFEFPWLLLSNLIGCNHGSDFEWLCSVDKFLPSACLPVSTSKTVKPVCVCVCMWPLCGTEKCACACLLLNRALESTYRENLSAFYTPIVSVPMVTGFHPPRFFAPPAQHVCPRGALLPASNCHSPGALSSAGGKILNHNFYSKKYFYNYVFPSNCT